ncbi:hypothetical protein [Sphingobium sp.]|uniref:hypothetical protein n=1 Tax=Sphingobium sp. TaxID=1912891 RepID=UPI000DB23B9D|nr:hypothetical protein [Sphingobium sp.]PZU67241.1 MAG: hypothetical protein DI540_11665 [Sphingobium sp.]
MRVRDTDTYLAWNWDEDNFKIPLLRIVLMPCVEIEDGNAGFFLTCPVSVKRDSVAIELTSLRETGDAGVPMVLRLEDDAGEQKLVVYFIHKDGLTMYLSKRLFLMQMFASKGGQPRYVRQSDLPKLPGKSPDEDE